jgi:putative CocE/NonD family hydrolase
MFGISAGGILANFTAMTSPPALRCCFVCVAHGCDFRYGSYNGGVFIDDLNKRWFKALGHPLAEALKPRIGVYDDLAADMDLRNHYEKVQVPIFNACGWYDIFHESGIENYEGLQARGSGLAKGNQRLLVGAFAHLPINGKISYPKEAAKPDFEAVERWFARWLKDETTALVDLPKVKYFLMGDPFDKSAPGNEWRTADHWPPESTETSFWLASGGELRQDMPATTSQVEHVYDPKNPVPTIGGNNLFLQRGPMDQRPTRSRKDVLRFESAPLIEPMTIAGRVQAMLAVSTDAMDTDFMVKLVDVYPDGYEALVLDQPMRLRFRDGLADPKPAKKGEVYRIRINLGSTALAVAAGHRIAVHVQSSNSPRYEPHTNTWDPVKSYAEGVVARQQVYLGGSTGSRIVLPVVE